MSTWTRLLAPHVVMLASLNHRLMLTYMYVHIYKYIHTYIYIHKHMLYSFIYINRSTQPIADRIAQNVEFCFKFFVNEPGFCPWIYD